mgnify:FL=1
MHRMGRGGEVRLLLHIDVSEGTLKKMQFSKKLSKKTLSVD